MDEQKQKIREFIKSATREQIQWLVLELRDNGGVSELRQYIESLLRHPFEKP